MVALTERRTPLGRRRRPASLATLAVVPLLMLLAPIVSSSSLAATVAAGSPELVELLTLLPGAREKGAVRSVGSPAAAAVSAGSPELVELTLLPGAQEKGAVCLDGSPAAYHLQRGFGSGSRSWIVFLQGGAWCSTTKGCSWRKKTFLGSSNLMGPAEFVGILNNRPQQNPDFYNWNKAFLRYCDGASFSGDSVGEDQDGSKLFYRGLRIWEAVLDELMAQGMDSAQHALLTGCSAGGLAALLHCDNFRARFPEEVQVKCLSDAGFFLDAEDISGERYMRSVYDGVVHLQNVTKILPKDCLVKNGPTECFFPAELIKSIRTPTFLVNSAYDSWQIRNVLAPDGSYTGQSWSSCKANIRNCTSTQMDTLHGFRRQFVSEVEPAEEKEDWGMFIDSCFAHCQVQYDISWHSPASPRLGNRTIAEAVGDWYFGRKQGVDVKQIDCMYPCNPTCSSDLPT